MTVSKLVFTPLSYTGWGSLQQLLPEVKKYHPAHILIVTDPVLKDIGLVEPSLSRHTYLFGFPHPSGANGHRKRIFEEHLGEFTEIVEDWAAKRKS